MNFFGFFFILKKKFIFLFLRGIILENSVEYMIVLLAYIFRLVCILKNFI